MTFTKMKFKRVRTTKVPEIEQEKDSYDEHTLGKQIDDGEISAEEHGFMVGYLSA